jgi:hypothetical protein
MISSNPIRILFKKICQNTREEGRGFKFKKNKNKRKEVEDVGSCQVRNKEVDSL